MATLVALFEHTVMVDRTWISRELHRCTIENSGATPSVFPLDLVFYFI